MKRLIWDYEDALKARDAAVTWILICKKELVYERGLLCWNIAKKIAHYVFNGFDYANGKVHIAKRVPNLSGLGLPIYEYQNGVCKFLETRILNVTSLIWFGQYLLEAAYGKSYPKILWNGKPLEPHRCRAFLSRITPYISAHSTFTLMEENGTSKHCKTMRDLIDFVVELCKPITEEEWIEARPNFFSSMFKEQVYNVFLVSHKLKF